MGKNDNLLIPPADPYYYIDGETRRILGYMDRIARSHPVNILVTGRQGCGKSSLVRQFAAVNRRKLATFQVGILSEPGQLFGEHILENGETKYKEYLFSRALRTPGCVIHLEEINRPDHPKALNMLFSLLSDDREVYIDEIGTLKVADGVIFFATMNDGEEFVGTEMLDPALRDRFYTILMDYVPSDIEKRILREKTQITEAQASQIVDIINKLRGNSEMPLNVSIRSSLMVAELVQAGATVREAITYGLQVSREQLESLLLAVHLQNNMFEAQQAVGFERFQGQL